MSDFWSRRKAAVEAEADAVEKARVEVEQATAEKALAERSDEELLAEAGLCDPDTLDNAEQVQEFLRSALPQRLKTRALRRLWALNPALANLDGLVDYGEDFTDAATVVENLQTVYQVGKGMLSAFAQEESPGDVPEEVGEATETAIGEPTVSATEEEETDVAPFVSSEPDEGRVAAETEFDTDEMDFVPAMASSRRMRFRFDTPEGLT